MNIIKQRYTHIIRTDLRSQELFNSCTNECNIHFSMTALLICLNSSTVYFELMSEDSNY